MRSTAMNSEPKLGWAITLPFVVLSSVSTLVVAAVQPITGLVVLLMIVAIILVMWFCVRHEKRRIDKLKKSP